MQDRRDAVGHRPAIQVRDIQPVAGAEEDLEQGRQGRRVTGFVEAQGQPPVVDHAQVDPCLLYTSISGVGNFEQLLNLGAADQEPDANDAHIVTIVDWLFQYAFQQRASDIHIEPRREQGTVRFRIDGVLHNVYPVSYTHLDVYKRQLLHSASS